MCKVGEGVGQVVETRMDNFKRDFLPKRQKLGRRKMEK